MDVRVFVFCVHFLVAVCAYSSFVLVSFFFFFFFFLFLWNNFVICRLIGDKQSEDRVERQRCSTQLFASSIKFDFCFLHLLMSFVHCFARFFIMFIFSLCCLLTAHCFMCIIYRSTTRVLMTMMMLQYILRCIIWVLAGNTRLMNDFFFLLYAFAVCIRRHTHRSVQVWG